MRKRIKELCDINTRSLSVNDRWESYLYLDTGNITENHIDELVEFGEKDQLPSRARRKIKNDSVIFSTVRPNQKHFGMMGFHKLPNNLLVSTGFAVLDHNNKCDPYYLYYALTTDSNIEKLQMLAEQSVTSYPSITSDDIGNVEIEIPKDLETQKKISNVLLQIDKKIHLNLAINDNLA